MIGPLVPSRLALGRIDCTSFSTALVEYAAEQASSAAFASSAGPATAEPSGGCHGHIQSEG